MYGKGRYRDEDVGKSAGGKQEAIRAEGQGAGVSAWTEQIGKADHLSLIHILDKYFPDIPVYLLNKECHGAWVNSAALEMFGITKDTPDPVNGAYERFENGEPNGYLHEMAAINMQEKIFEFLNDEELAEYAKTFIRTANKYGITSLGDVAGTSPMRESAYKLIEDRGELTARIHFYPLFDAGLEQVLEKQQQYNSPKLRCNGVKTFIDGTPQGYSGYMLEDYSDRPGERSCAMIEPEEFIHQVCDCLLYTSRCV